MTAHQVIEINSASIHHSWVTKPPADNGAVMRIVSRLFSLPQPRCPRNWGAGWMTSILKQEHHLGSLALLVCVLISLAASRSQAQLNNNQAQDSIIPVSETAAYNARRLVQTFDFEETDDAGVALARTQPMPMRVYAIGRPADTADPNFHNHPLHQMLMQTPGFPAYTQVGYAADQAASGQYSLRLGLDSGNAGAFVEIGTMAAIPHCSYLTEAMVKTKGLKHAQAFIEAYFVDIQGQEIPGSRTRSAPLSHQSDWQHISITLAGQYNTAAWIGLELKVEQPIADQSNPLGPHQILLQDVTGEAWFDDIRIWQLPTVKMRSQASHNIIRFPHQPTLAMRVRDLTGNQLIARTRLFDAYGRLVDSMQRVIGGGTPTQWSWQPALPAFGYYHAVLEIIETQGTHTGVVDRQHVHLVWMPEQGTASLEDAARFQLVAEQAPPLVLKHLASGLDHLNLQAMTTSLWEKDTQLNHVEKRIALVNDAILPSLTSGKKITVSLNPVPRQLIDRLNLPVANATEVVGLPHEDWAAFSGTAFRLLGQRIHDWQIGSANDPTSQTQSDPAAITKAVNALKNLVPDPVTVLPWPIDQSPPPLPADHLQVLLNVPANIAANSLPEYLQAWPQDQRGVYLKPMPAEHADTDPLYSHEHRITDLVQRMVLSWETQVEQIAFPADWDPVSINSIEPQLRPEPLLGVFANTAHRLAGRRVVGQLPIEPGIQCMILDGTAGGMLVLWNEKGPQDAKLHTKLTVNPDTQVTEIDVWGNRRAIVPDSQNKHLIRIGRTPIFVEGIDAKLALFRAGFTLTPAFVTATQRGHERTLTLVNPWPFTITGQFRLTRPSDWTIQPARHTFSIASGSTREIPIRITTPASEVAGDKYLIADMQLQTNEPVELDLVAPVELGLESISCEATLALQPNPDGGRSDLVATLVIQNTSQEDQSLYAFASLYGYPRQEKFIVQLEPGQSLVRRFLFPHGAQAIAQHALRTGVREARGPAVLNLRLTREDLQ